MCSSGILSFLILPLKQTDNKELLMNFKKFVDSTIFWEFVIKHKIKVTLLGKWYSLPSEIVDSLKRVVSDTRDYDCFFLNFCVNYDGKEELVDAFKLINRKVLAGKLDPDKITKQTIKENIYTSYFVPPNIIIKSSSIIANNPTKTGVKYFIISFLLNSSFLTFS